MLVSGALLIQKLLKDELCGDLIDHLFPRASRRVQCSQGSLSLHRREPFVHHVNRNRHHAAQRFDKRRDLLRLRTVFAPQCQRQPHNDGVDVMRCDNGLERLAVLRCAASCQHHQRLRGQPQRIAECHPNAPITHV